MESSSDAELTWKESDIIAQAKQHNQQQKKERYVNDIQESFGLTRDLDYYDLLQFFDIQKEDLFNREVIRKIDTIYEYLKEKGNVLKEAKRLDIQLGRPLLMNKLNKFYSEIHLWNLEKGIQDKRTRDIKTEQKIKEKKQRHQSRLLDKKKAQEKAKYQQKAEIEREKHIKRIRAIQEQKHKKEQEKRMSQIKETKHKEEDLSIYNKDLI